MSDNKLLFFIVMLVIVYLLSVFHRGKLEFAKFLLGSVSTFFILFFSLQNIMTPFLAKEVATTTGLLGRLTNTFVAYANYGILFINNAGKTISLYIDYECAGFIEMTIFISLIAFFPVYNIGQKFVTSLIGLICIFLANVIRLFSICIIIYFFGNSAFYFAHTIFGRIIFYTISMCLYYFMFTKSQILNQKIGNFSYVKNNSK